MGSANRSRAEILGRRLAIQAAPQPELRVLSSEGSVSYLTLLRNRNFRRFFLAQFVSSLGDWVGVIAIVVYANKLGGGPAAVGLVMTARVLPGFVIGPLAGVIADRWDRKKTMVIADMLRAVIIFSLPFVPNLVFLLLASAALESLTLIWGPAKDASLPHFVKTEHLTHANSLSLIAVYGPWPLSSIVFALLATLATFLGSRVPALEGLVGNEEALALWLDSLTFAFSAVMIGSLVIPSSVRRAGRLDFSAVRRDLVQGIRFVVEHKQVRPWLLGIAFTFTAAGAVFSMGVDFSNNVLQAGDRGFAILIGFLGTGMIIGLLAVGGLARRIHKDVLFSSSIVLSGVSLIAFAGMGSLDQAIPIASALGFFGGAAYSTGYSLMHETTSDELRGRTFSAAYTIIRIGTLVGLGLFPVVADLIGNHDVTLPWGSLDLPGTRSTLWIAGAFALFGGVLSMRAIRARGPMVHAVPSSAKGYFVVFEGGEGAGKSTQMSALVRWLEARGEAVVTTREPGGTAIGSRIRDLLLDPEATEMSPQAEALLYAADRAQHVAEVIRPALEAGKVVVSDRFVDSSLAYQGLARGLGLEDIYRISEWATGGLLPDVVFYLKLDPEEGLRRVEGQLDRIESERDDFHRRVSSAYSELAARYPHRFVVLDASKSQSEVHKQAISALENRTDARVTRITEGQTLQRPGPLPR